MKGRTSDCGGSRRLNRRSYRSHEGLWLYLICWYSDMEINSESCGTQTSKAASGG